MAAGPSWERWIRVDDFTHQQGSDEVFVLDHVSGDLVRPSVWMADGSVRQYGAVPPKGSPIRMLHRSWPGAVPARR